MAHDLEWSDTWVFALNFLVIILLSKLLELAAKDVSLRVGRMSGSLLNVTFGNNVVELILSAIAFMDGQIRVVQASLLGSILSNLLLVLGMCIVSRGRRIFHEEEFNQTAESIIALACIGLISPTALNFFVRNSNTNSKELSSLSHGTVIVLLIIYFLYLYFQLKSHPHPYHEEGEQPKSSPIISISLLAVVFIVVIFSSKCLIGSIDGVVQSLGLSRTFVGFVLLPIVGNAAEIMTVVTTTINNRTGLSININDDAYGNSVQIILFVTATPFFAVLGWIIINEMTLHFQSLEAAVFVIAFLMANYLIQKYNLQKFKEKFWSSI
ncbi:hypothetical protein RhiirA5_400907 [Rhizophagus irregularis]|uniref:Vacuolar calcium ion transporter n=1 Tax=Rhizophagus irregularis TaxID=588596 RepID=A0A2N0PFD4_9GLOM|nr:hypothetical protein RhiirA5_400907 [Rhizophagus irregularis]